ncbi:MAG: pyridoxal phosphate-dependent aminotransferase [Elusimicrobia bacterium]|nr:pyridoxal phosphate-dependent aminotransferase [Elusimicrobiota bacterium]
MTKVPFAAAMSRLGTETAFEVLARARALEAQGRKIVHQEIGEPDFDTPKNIRDRAKKALDEGWTHYGPSAGLPEARAAVAEYVAKSRGIKVSPEEVLLVPGGKPVIFFTILALCQPGDEVIFPDPGFPIYESMIRFVGATPVSLPIREENDFSVDPADLKRLLNRKTKLVILNSPANPTGGVLTEDHLDKIVKLLAKFPAATILSDEIYSRVLYSGEHRSILSYPGMKERCVLLDGFSKTYAMTGWRLGYGVANKTLTAAMARLATNCHSCAPSFVQIAGVEALKGPQRDVELMVAEFKKRRDVIVDGLNDIPGVSCKRPEGAFYAFPNIKATGFSSKELADLLLDKAGVAALSGTCFGAGGEGYLRFSYANSIAEIQKALKLMRELLASVPSVRR